MSHDTTSIGAYAVWDELVARLRHKDNHQRVMALRADAKRDRPQLLCTLAKSDP